MNIFPFFGWREGTFKEYCTAYDKHGGSTAVSPEILNFLHERHSLNERFFIHKNGGGVCVWKDKYLAGDQRAVHKYMGTRYPLNFDEIVLPVPSGFHVALPSRTKFLSNLSHKTICNSSHLLNAKREISIVKNVSGKTRSSRNRELKKFIKDGGEVHSLDNFDTKNITRIYAELFYQRRGERPDMTSSIDLLNHCKNLLWGHVLTFNGEPCAMQWITKTEDRNRIYLDYVNAGMRMDITNHSIGTLCAWVNIKEAFDLGDKINKEVRFSFGRPTMDYKERWCLREPLFRVLY